MSKAGNVSAAIVGGIYIEHCMRPAWHEIYGSAGRAASAMASMGVSPTLHGYMDMTAREVLLARGTLEGFSLAGTAVSQSIAFDYDHGLATPRIYGQRNSEPAITLTADAILRFGMFEGDAVVHGQRVVYDPQDALVPEAFHANGSTAKELALVLNRNEATLMSGLKNASVQAIAKALIEKRCADIVVIKQGPQGALVHDGRCVEPIPAYLSRSVWKIGSGDTFAAHFAFNWMIEGKSAVESADAASRATAYYCQTRGFPTSDSLESFTPDAIVPSPAFCAGRKPTVYLAGPFFTLAQLWIVEQARHDLESMGLKVFSPYHDVGHGSAEDVVKLDLKGIEDSDIIFAIGDGMDSGTIYEIGYARAKGKPVVLYCENESIENKKMMEGSNCHLHVDYVSAIYATLWIAACDQ